MNNYTIYCTEEQTRKALELGAPILVTPEEFYETLPHFNMNICGENASVILPTAEEMLGWLEDLGGIEEITVCKTGMWIWGENHTLIKGSPNYSSRQKATLAAIDAALEYLNNNKK